MGGGGDSDVEPKESAEERELAKISKEQVDRWWNVGRPAQMEWVEDGQVSEGDRGLMRGEVGANVHKQTQGLRNSLDTQQQQRGLAPTGGAATMGRSNLEGDATGKVGSQAQSTGQHAMTNKNLGHLMNVTSVMRGEGVDAQQGMSSLAKTATEDSINDAKMNYYDNKTEGSTAGAAVGIGLSGLENHYTNKNKG